MRALYLALVCLGCSANWNTAAESVAVAYRIAIEPEKQGIAVEGSVRGKGLTFKGWTGTRWLGERAKVDVGRENDILHFRYFLKVDQKTFLKTAEPVLNDEMAYAWLNQVLVGPVVVGDIETFSVQISAPEGWKIVTTHGEYKNEMIFDTYKRMGGVILCSGDYAIEEYSLKHSGGSKSTEVTLAVQGDRKWRDKEYFATMKKLLDAHVAYFGGAHPATAQCIILHQLPRGNHPDIPGFNRWVDGDDTILAVHTPDRPWGHFEFFGMLSHEHLHCWYPHAMPSDLGPWFIEGLNDYVAYDILRSSGIHSVENTTAMFSKWYREYLGCVQRNDQRLMPYRRGMIAAWIFDLEIQRATNGEKGLRDLLLGLFRSSPESGKVGKQDFLNQIRHFTEKDFSDLYATLVEKDDLIDVPSFLKGSIYRCDAESQTILLTKP